MRSTKLTVLVGLLSFLAIGTASKPPQESFDLLITGGRVLDGSGNPWFYADVGIRDGKIAAVGQLAGAKAVRTIDARGKNISPGFIDLHSHADEGLGSDDARRRAAPNLVSQGVTTVVVNQDGRSPWPIGAQRARLEQLKIGPNAILMVGHGAGRRRVMGSDFQRAATGAEVEKMHELVRQGMKDGARGLSAGLEYVPGRWSSTDEVVSLVEEIVPSGGIYISHERSEGSDPMWYWPSRDKPGPPTLLDAVRETIEIGRRTRATVVASHIKAKGAHYWGSGYAVIQLIEQARKEGVDIWADQYPYDTTGSDGSTVLIPSWVFGDEVKRDYAAALRQVLSDKTAVLSLKGDIEHEIFRRGGAEKIVIFEYPHAGFIGKTLTQLAEARKISPVEMAIALQLEGYPQSRGGARLRGFSLSEYDIEAYAARSWTATASDAGIALPEDGPVHARFYGTFPRKIRRYALERNVLSLEDAVRSATLLPAQILRLRDRGMIREGSNADLVIFDPERIADRATFSEPHQYADGIDSVLVNGQFVVDGGKLTWGLPGRVLSNQSK